MRNVNSKIWLIFLIGIVSACTSFQTPKTPQDAINEAYVVITATAQQIAANKTAGIMTAQERDVAISELRNYEAKVDTAQILLKNGDITGSQQQLALINSALMSLQKRVADKARNK